MKLKIVYEYNPIVFSKVKFNKSLFFEGMINNKYILKQFFYKTNSKIIEINCVKQINLLQYVINNLTYNEECLLVLHEINDENIAILNEIYKRKKNLIIIAGEVKVDIECCDFKIINVFPQIAFKNIESIDIEVMLFSFTLFDKNELKYDYKIKRTILTGKRIGENAFGEIAFEILNNFNDFQYSNKLKIYLYSNRNFNIKELAYIEDPLKEYIMDNCKLNIKQIENSKLDDEIIFSLLGEQK